MADSLWWPLLSAAEPHLTWLGRECLRALGRTEAMLRATIVISSATRQLIERRLAAELGRLPPGGDRRIALVYPSPYGVAMSSLGFQAVHPMLADLPDVACERAFLPDSACEGTTLERPYAAPTLATVTQPVAFNDDASRQRPEAR